MAIGILASIAAFEVMAQNDAAPPIAGSGIPREQALATSCDGAVTATRPVTDLFDAKFTQLDGAETGDEFGGNVSAGDFDRDGFSEIGRAHV